MNFFLFRFFAFIFCFFSVVVSIANPGFVHGIDNFPADFQMQAQRVFMVYSKKVRQPRGTAYLVYNDGTTAMFVTARHVLHPAGSHNIENSVSDFSVHQNGFWQNGEQPRFSDSLKLKTTEVGAPNGTSSEFRESGTPADIGYLITESNPKLPIVKLNDIGPSVKDIVTEDLSNVRHYVLGYPVIKISEDSRKFARLQLSLSSGDFFEGQNFNEKFMVGSTADSRSGNSGSPVFTKDGRLLGLVTSGPERYVLYPQMNSTLVPIDYIKTMIENLVHKQNHNLVQVFSCSRVYSRPNFVH